MNEVEQLVIKNLLLDEEYVRKAMPFITVSYTHLRAHET